MTSHTPASFVSPNAMRIALFLFAFALTPATLLAQAHGGCSEHPQTLHSMKTCYRPVLVFSPSGSDARLRKQEALLDPDADDMMDRNMLFIPVLASAKAYTAPLDAPSTTMTAAEQKRLRARYGVSPAAFKVALLNEDGDDVLTSSEPVSTDRMNALIDRMPRRKEEMQQKDSN